MVNKYLRYGLVCFLMLLSPFSFALKCIAPPSFGESFGKAQTVFIAKVASISKDGLTAEYVVDKLYKGDIIPELKKMTINPMAHWFDNTFFHKDEKYLAFYRHDEELAWSVCAKNIILINDKNVALLELIISLQTMSLTLEREL